MSEQHTPWRLKVGDSGSIAFDENGRAVFEECPHGGIGKIQGKKNIRRAVACWNLLVDVPTEEIEAAENYGASCGKTGLELAAEAKAPQQPAPAPPQKPELRVGQVWRTRGGGVVKIKFETRILEYPFMCESNEHSWSVTKRGMKWGDDMPDPEDLIKLISDVPQEGGGA